MEFEKRNKKDILQCGGHACSIFAVDGGNLFR